MGRHKSTHIITNELGIIHSTAKTLQPPSQIEPASEVTVIFDERELAYEMACESIVLLKNDGILPLSKEKKTIYEWQTSYNR